MARRRTYRYLPLPCELHPMTAVAPPLMEVPATRISGIINMTGGLTNRDFYNDEIERGSTREEALLEAYGHPPRRQCNSSKLLIPAHIAS